MIRYLFFLLIPLLIVTSCGQKQETFIDVNKLNEAIVDKCNIDVEEFNSRVNSIYQDDTIFFYNVMNEFIFASNAELLYKKFGFIKKKDGSTITRTEGRLITQELYKAYRDCIFVDNCKGLKNNTICAEKLKIKNSITKIIEEGSFFRLSEFSRHIFDLHTEGLISEHEYRYMIGFIYTLVSANVSPPAR